MSNSPLRGLRRAAPLVPAAHFLRPGWCVRLALSPPHLRCVYRRLGGLAPKSLASAAAPAPKRGGRRSAGRRTCLNVALVRRDATLARRGPSRATGTPPLGAPPWRCRPRNRSGPVLRIRPEGYSRPAIVHGGLRHRAFRSRAYRRGETPLPAPPAGSSPETAPHEQGWRILYCIFVK